MFLVLKKITYLLPCLLGLITLSACDGAKTPASANAVMSAAQLGEQIFNDLSLSASGQQACASCHDKNLAFASNVAVNSGGIALQLTGIRNAPSLTYISTTPAFAFDKQGAPMGGFFHDGRVENLIAQAGKPFLAANEMANSSPADVITKLKQASYAPAFKALFGENIFEQGDKAFDRALFALAAFEREDKNFNAFSSKFDAFLQGKASLSLQETRGLALFNNPQKGNCAACHPSAKSNGNPPLFTDFSYDNIGVPRNVAIAANADAQFYDLGLCGPVRNDLVERSDLCGAFKVPSLRNVEKTAPYFHNGQFSTLTEVLRFYVRRDTHPEDFYPKNADGTVHKFNDVPVQYVRNVNTAEAPFNRKLGDEPALNDEEKNDVIAFLKTLTDGYQP